MTSRVSQPPTAAAPAACPRLVAPGASLSPCCSPTGTSEPRSPRDGSSSTPWDASMVQPSSIDVRLDKYFRLFDNHRYPYIDPAQEQPDLTRLVEVGSDDEGFVLHPGSSSSARPSGGQPAGRPRRSGRREVEPGPARAAHPRDGRLRRPRVLGACHLRAVQCRDAADHALPGMKIGQLCFFRLSSAAENPTGRRLTDLITRASADRPPAGRSRTSTRPRSKGFRSLGPSRGSTRRAPRPQPVIRRPAS